MKILEKTITEMPKSFTSNEFGKRAIKNGYPYRKLKRKGLASFLWKYADNAYKGSKTWIKRDKTNNIMSEDKTNNIMSEDKTNNIMSEYKTNNIMSEYKINNTMSEYEMIKYLKSKGYKIMKPFNDWIEC